MTSQIAIFGPEDGSHRPVRADRPAHDPRHARDRRRGRGGLTGRDDTHAHIGPGGITIPAGASALDALSGRVGQLERKVAAVNPRLPTTDR